MAVFSKRAVWTQQTTSGFGQQAFVMFHATDADSAASILQEGFRVSTGSYQMLGNGVYVSATRAKTSAYGDVVFKLLVYPGRVARVDYQGHPMQKRWHQCYGSAWVPPNCGMVQSGYQVRHIINRSCQVLWQSFGIQENCIKSDSQILILGVCKGYSLLDEDSKDLARNLCNKYESQKLNLKMFLISA